jgi:hypothetical protein
MTAIVCILGSAFPEDDAQVIDQAPEGQSERRRRDDLGLAGRVEVQRLDDGVIDGATRRTGVDQAEDMPGRRIGDAHRLEIRDALGRGHDGDLQGQSDRGDRTEVDAHQRMSRVKWSTDSTRSIFFTRKPPIPKFLYAAASASS